LDLRDDRGRLGVAAVLVIDDRLEDQRLRKVLVTEERAGEGDEIPKRLLVLPDAVVGPGALEQRLQPLRLPALDLPVIVEGVAVLPRTVVDARKLHEGEIP